MVGGTVGQNGVAVCSGEQERGGGDRWRGIACHGFEDDGVGRDSGIVQFVAHEKPVDLVADDYRAFETGLAM